jgi:Helix-turn-helix domain
MKAIPLVRRRLLGAALRRYRENVGYTMEDVARLLECDRSKLSRIETGQRGIRLRELRELLAEYGADEGESRALQAIADPRGPVTPGAGGAVPGTTTGARAFRRTPPFRRPARGYPPAAFTLAGRPGTPYATACAAASTSTWPRTPRSAPCSCSSLSASSVKATVPRTCSGHRSTVRWSQLATWTSDPATTARTRTAVVGPAAAGPDGSPACCSSGALPGCRTAPGVMRSRTSRRRPADSCGAGPRR